MKAKRFLHLVGTGLPPLEVSKVFEIDIPKRIFYIEERRDGTFQLSFSKPMLPDITQLMSITLVREVEN